MKTMKALIVKRPGEVGIEQIPMPIVGEYECLAHMRTCGFCNGTDFQTINGTLKHGDDELHYPLVLGHEGACEVVELGSKVRHIKIGDRFIRPELPYDPKLGYTISYGNMAEYVVVRDYRAMWEDGLLKGDTMPYVDNCAPIPKDIDFNDGAAMVSLLECISAAIHFDVKKGGDVLIYGAGPMGLSIMQFFFVLGAATVTMVDGIEDRLEKAMYFGATRAINFAKQNLDEALEGKKFDAVVDAVGSTKILMEASWRLKPCGKVCGLGVLRADDVNINLKMLQNNTSIHMHNFQSFRFAYVDRVVELIREKKIDTKTCYSHVMPVEDYQKCMDMVKNKEAFKVLLTF